MSLPGKIESAIPSVPGFDCVTTISQSLAQQFYEQGYKFCFRYLSRGPEASGDLSATEAAGILKAGLALMPVQRAHPKEWSPSQALGQKDGSDAAANAQNVGFPGGVNLWCDLEGVSKSSAHQDVIDYCTAWYDAVKAAGYVPGLYVGAGELLTGAELYSLPFQHYWRSPSNVPDVLPRSYQAFQLSPSIPVNGITIDLDVTTNDNEGGTAQWLRANATLSGIQSVPKARQGVRKGRRTTPRRACTSK